MPLSFSISRTGLLKKTGAAGIALLLGLLLGSSSASAVPVTSSSTDGVSQGPVIPSTTDPNGTLSSTADKILVLYDSSGQYGWLGEVYARQMANLLGHFTMAYDYKPVENYGTNGLLIENYRTTFYIGSSFDNPLPQKFLDDVMNTDKTVCWFKNNIWKAAWLPAPVGTAMNFVNNPYFTNRFGFQFNSFSSAARPQIIYRGTSLAKYQGDPELAWCDVTTAWKNPSTTLSSVIGGISPTSTTSIPSFACSDKGDNCIPYVIHGRNLWYFADLPFSYVSETDRYLVFCDMIYDILGVPAPVARHRAMVRLEDVSPDYDPAILRQMADYLASEGVPFSVAVIPIYTDPLGAYNNKVPVTIKMSETPAFTDALKYMVSKGGTLIMHGTTHQNGNEVNPFTGVSGDDYEFFRVKTDATGKIVENRALPEDSWEWVTERIRTGLKEFEASGLTASAFEPPHYAASPLDYTYFASKFKLTIQRVLYFNYAVGTKGARMGDQSAPTFFSGQFFPYVIHKDIYGQKVAPENLGNVEPEPWEGLYPARLPKDLINAASKNLVVRDGWASFFYHPFYGLDYLKETVQGIKGLGYTFVPLSADME